MVVVGLNGSKMTDYIGMRNNVKYWWKGGAAWL